MVYIRITIYGKVDAIAKKKRKKGYSIDPDGLLQSPNYFVWQYFHLWSKRWGPDPSNMPKQNKSKQHAPEVDSPAQLTHSLVLSTLEISRQDYA